MRFIVDQEVFEKLPNACFGVVVAKGVDNRHMHSEIDALLDESIIGIRQRLEAANVREVPEIAVYREAFQKLGFNPNKYMCSIEALVKRILKGDEFPRISSVVDLGNSVSLKHILPIGAHDIKASTEDIEIRAARQEDRFIPFGMSEAETADAGELVYVRGNSIKTRRWIWRQSESGRITGESTDIFYPIDGLTGVNDAAVLAARDELAGILEQHMECCVTVGWVDRNSNQMTLD